MLTPEKYAEAGTEHAHQVALFMYFARLNADFKLGENFLDHIRYTDGLDWTKHDNKVLKLMFAIPNGGLRDKITAGRLKAEGVKSGVPDIMLPVAKYGNTQYDVEPTYYHGLFIELKRPRSVGKRKGVVAEKQSDYALALIEQGYAVETCYGWIEARQAIWNYLH